MKTIAPKGIESTLKFGIPIITLEQVIQIIDSKESIPLDARKAIRDFVEDNFQEIVENPNDLTDIIPDPILEYADIIIEIIRSVI